MAADRGLVLLTCCWMLICMCCQPLTGASRLSTAYQRALQESHSGSHKPQVIRAELMHRDHPESPLRLSRGATSAADRHGASVSWQQARIARRLGAGVEFKTIVSSGWPYERPFQYVMTLYLGTPVQRFFLIMDTGSDLVWVQCRPCSPPFRCYNATNPIFDPASSSSYSAVPCRNITCDPYKLNAPATCNLLKNCQITYAYELPGSGIAGVLSTETISFSNTTEGQLGISNFLFGCMNNDTASFGTVDGLVGFGRGPLSLPSQLSQLTSLNVFSYCLVPSLVSPNLTSSLLFGASDSNGLQLAYTPIMDNPDMMSAYWVNMTGITVNGTAVRIPKAPLEWNSSSSSGGTILDSGTFYTLFSPDLWTPVVQSLKGAITYPIVLAGNTSVCYNISGVQQPAFPSVSFQFSGFDGGIVDFPLAAQNLFFPALIDDVPVQCLAILPSNLSPNIIGSSAQADHYIESDLVNMKVGWTLRDCSLPL